MKAIYPPPSKSFVAIDVEYADSAQNICQIGVAVVRNLEITERISWLIRPPYNEYDEIQSRIHGITSADTEIMPEFPDVWLEIQPYFLMGELWAHNANSTEQPVLKKNLRMYGFNADFISIRDSRDLYQRPDCPCNKGNGLAQCCMAMGISSDNHHDALADAVMCAQLVIGYIQGQEPDWTGVPMTDEEVRKSQQAKVILRPGEFLPYSEKPSESTQKRLSIFDDFDSETNSFTADAPNHVDLFAELTSTYTGAQPQLVDVFDKGDLLPKDGQDQIDFSRLDMGDGNPLCGKTVAMTGFFHFSRKEIERALAAMKITKIDGMTGKTDILLVGSKNVGLSKLAKYDKQCAKGRTIALVVGDADLDALLYGDGLKFFYS